MRHLPIISALLFLTSVISSSPVNHNRVGLKSIQQSHTDQSLTLDADWTHFLFTNVGVPVSPNFVLTAPILPPSTQLQIVDLFCSGDVFHVFNNGSELFGTIYPPYGVDCQLSTDDATLAFSQEYWSKSVHDIDLGATYNLTVYPTASPWSAGQAAIRWISLPF
jgi:hypothetical protein